LATIGVALTLFFSGSPGAFAQGKALTIDAIFDQDQRVDFNGAPPTTLSWLDANHYLWVRRTNDGRGREFLKVDANDGRTESLFDVYKFESALAAVPGVTVGDAAAAAGDLALNPQNTGALVDIRNDLYYFDFSSSKATRLTNTVEDEEEATFSPDGRHVAF